jgi:TonB family protein
MTDALQWMGYCALVSALLMGGAVAMESAMRATRRATRWCWLAALAGSLVLPIASYFTPVHIPYVASELSIETSFSAPAALVAAPTPAAPRHIGLILWATSSLLVLGFITYSYLRLRAARRSWTRSEVNGVAVWLSEDMGPAALGVARADIVLPRWVLSLEKRALDLMMLHEREHLRAWDPRLMLASILLAGTLPWNPFGWLMVRRLRLAIEVDCDARVLARDPDPAGYGAVLLEVSRRRASATFALSTFAEPRSQLEVRIRRMAGHPHRRYVMRAAMLSATALLFATAAFATRAPMHGRTVMDAPASSDVVIDLAAQPTAGYDTVAPVLQNADAVKREINRLYPPRLRDAGIEGTSTVAVFVSSSGKVTDTKLAATSGEALMDDAALRAAATMVFSPAVSQGRRIGMLVMVRIPFSATVTGPEIIAARSSARVTPPAPTLNPPVVKSPSGKKGAPTIPPPTVKPPTVSKGSVRTAAGYTVIKDSVAYVRNADGSVDTTIYIRRPEPAITPVTNPPVLLNSEEVQRRIATSYPPALRDAGIGGTVDVWFYINEQGQPVKQMIRTPSGRAELDQAALKVAPVLRFAPALGPNGAPTSLWISLKIIFNPSGPTSVEQKSAVIADTTAGGRTRISYGKSGPPTLESREADSAKPFVTAMDVQPKLVNRDEVAATIAREYPSSLRAAGIGGRTKVWFFIDEKGNTIKNLIHTSSGIDELDAAALRVASTVKFTPAQSRGEPVRVWVALDIVFQVK